MKRAILNVLPHAGHKCLYKNIQNWNVVIMHKDYATRFSCKLTPGFDYRLCLFVFSGKIIIGNNKIRLLL